MKTKVVRRVLLCCFVWVVFSTINLPSPVFADKLRLRVSEEGAEVELLEERLDAFIVKIPKSEVGLMKREIPSEMKLWKEKKILWEDQGDYLVISLPKERLIPLSEPASEGSLGYQTATSLKEGLAATGEKGRISSVGMMSGRVTGRVLHNNQPLAGCRVKLSAIPGMTTELSRLLGSGSSHPSSQTTFEVTTGPDGTYFIEEVPVGDYDISWLPPDSKHWFGWLSEKPDVTVRAGEITQQGDIEL